MKITNVRVERLTGHLDPADLPDGVLWEERVARPIDAYPEYRDEGAEQFPRTPDGKYVIVGQFVHIDTDEGVSGLAGPLHAGEAYVILTQIRPLIVGEDPLATERIWDLVYRGLVHGRKGTTMMALSAVDCALWDLKGKAFGVPVYRLLGGAIRKVIPAYVSTLGFSLEPERVRERAAEFKRQGYRAQKWFFRHGPSAGVEGMRRNVELVRAAREAIGDDDDLMLDCWMGWDLPYAVAMDQLVREYRPRWFEEPLLPDRIAGHAELRRQIVTPVATGEHEYTRWGHKALLDAGAADVLQPDIYWAGGLSETLKICNIASTYEVPVFPHGHGTCATAHLLASQPAALCPEVEYLPKWQQVNQFFFKEPLVPVNGFVTVPERPGMGEEIDAGKIVDRAEVRF